MAVADGQKVATPWLPNGGTVSQQFGVQEYIPSLGINAPHEGVDIATATGSPLVLPSSTHAVVDRAGWDPFGGGNAMRLKLDDGTIVQLFHLSDVVVKSGQDLTGGSLLGHTGSTGLSTGPHLHFQVDQNGKPVDPWNWITNLGSSGGSATGGSLNPLDAFKNVNDFFGHLITPGHDPCSPPADEVGLFKIIDAASCPQNWWKVGFIGAGGVLIILGLVIYFFQEEKAAAVVVVRGAEVAA